MNRNIVCITSAVAAGVAVVYLLPPAWLGPLAEAAAICAAILVVIIRIGTTTKPPENLAAGLTLQLLNLPERPLAEVKKDWALTAFFTSSAFLVSLGLSVMVRAGA